MADVSFYWGQTKKEAKKITGVDKMSTGWLNGGSGISKPLDAYVIAWSTKKDYKKAAATALVKINKYLKDIVEKEVKDIEKKAKGKAGLSEAEKKSCKLIRTNLHYIRDELTEVAKGNKQPGGFDGDAQADIRKTEDSMENPKHLEKLVAYENNSKQVVALSKKYVKLYQGRLSNLKQTLGQASAELKAAKASHANSDDKTNQSALSNIRNFAEAAEAEFKSIYSHWAKNVEGDKKFAAARIDKLEIGGGDKLSKTLLKRLKASFNSCDAENRHIIKVRTDVATVRDAIKNIAIEADAYSVEPLDMSQIIDRIDELVADSEEMRVSLKLEVKRLPSTMKSLNTVFTVYADKGINIMEYYDVYKKKMENTLAIIDTESRKLKPIEAWLKSCKTQLANPLVKRKAAAIVKAVAESKGYAAIGLKEKANAHAALKKSAQEAAKYQALQKAKAAA